MFLQVILENTKIQTNLKSSVKNWLLVQARQSYTHFQVPVKIQLNISKTRIEWGGFSPIFASKTSP